MAGGSSGPAPSASGKKSVDFQLNMIPFIDLLSVMISFLLFTAMWTQISKIDVQQKPTEPASEPSADPNEGLDLSVIIKASGYALSTRGGGTKEISGFNADALNQELASIRAQHPDNAAVTVTSEDAVPYRELIRVMDACLKNALTAISVAGI